MASGLNFKLPQVRRCKVTLGVTPVTLGISREMKGSKLYQVIQCYTGSVVLLR